MNTPLRVSVKQEWKELEGPSEECVSNLIAILKTPGKLHVPQRREVVLKLHFTYAEASANSGLRGGLRF